MSDLPDWDTLTTIARTLPPAAAAARWLYRRWRGRQPADD